MGKKPYATICGFGVGIIMWILEMAGVSMPLWLLIVLGFIALGMIFFGSIPVAVRVYHGIQRVKLRTPFVIVHPRVTKALQEQLTQEMIVEEYSPHVRETLDALIKRGEELTHQMQRDDFHRGQLGREVRQWLDSVGHDVWEVIPEHANLLTTNQRSTQETFTDQERLRYGGWNRNAATLRVSVDRQLLHLREIRSRIQATDSPQGRNENRAITRKSEPTKHE